ncbi:MAG: phosphatase PAP2 family protein [Myxococcota bacterium]
MHPNNDTAASADSFSRREIQTPTSAPLVVVFVAAYLAWTAATVGLRLEHFIISFVFGALFLVPKTATFARYAFPFFFAGILYDNFRLIADLRGTIRVDELYQAELAWFGVETATGPKVLPLFMQDYTHPFLDLICGLAYLLYLPVTFAVGIAMFFVDRSRMSVLGWSFLFVNILGMITYLAYPAAPPWYVQDYGLGPAILDAKPSAAGAARFDAYLGVTIFEQFYSRSANVFGAMPSLHCAYPTVAFLVVWRLSPGWALSTGFFALLVMFSAVYLQHHYVWDVLIGVLYAFVVVFAVRRVLVGRTAEPTSTSSESPLKNQKEANN